jgi:hypothetical protein|tara:strand:+ start:159 stop:299 length:141 start_codon:yes stop_codon:yes gene_type:complete
MLKNVPIVAFMTGLAINPFDQDGTWRTAVAVGQNIYTPENIGWPAR